MTDGVIITGIICTTLIIICWLPRRKDKESKYKYQVIHVPAPREKQATAIADAINAGIAMFGGEVVAIINEPYYPDMKAPMYEIIIKSPVKSRKDSRQQNPNPNYRPPMKGRNNGQ